MREIKFRAFDKDAFNNKMTHFDIDSLCYHNYIVWEQMLKHEHPIMQYTGLKDKNGKEIYEGDILCVEFEKSRSLNHFDIYLKQWKHEVKWDGQGFNIPNIEGEFRQSLCTAIHNQNKPTPEWEVIGNIYEHKHLLNKEQ